jgi:TRAP-type uncharacterized transport system fused permease subunit
MKGLPRERRRSRLQSLIYSLMTISGFVILSGLVYYGFGWTKTVLGETTTPLAGALMVAIYIVLLRLRSKHPDLPLDDPRSPLIKVPDFYEVAVTGLHYFVPVFVLIWCLMIEEMSPGLAAFWGVVFMGGLVLTQRPLMTFFRGERSYAQEWRAGIVEFIAGLEAGGRNMAGVGIATATAGIVVGTVTLTGVGLVMTEIVEFLSAGNFVTMLVLVGLICLVLGAGLPTTASYVVVATLMAPVVVELAAENDIAVPLISVHMFVFYFGLMADVSPPVGLAAYAAGAIAGADPMKVGWQGMRYENRTALLPFVFIFNPEILMIDIGGWLHFALVVLCCVLAMGCFVAASQNWLLTRNRWYETLLLLLVCFTLFRPGYWLNNIMPPFEDRPASEVTRVAGELRTGSTIRIRLASQTRLGEDVDKIIRLTMRTGGSGADRLKRAGLTLSTLGDTVTVQSVAFGSEASKYGLSQGDTILAVLVPTERPDPFWFTIPAFLLLGGIVFLQRRRKRRRAVAAAA